MSLFRIELLSACYCLWSVESCSCYVVDYRLVNLLCSTIALTMYDAVCIIINPGQISKFSPPIKVYIQNPRHSHVH